MSRLSDIVSYRRQSVQGVISSLGGGIKERLKEKFDPRQIINQKGVLTSLFPGLKTYKSNTAKSSSRTSGEALEKSSTDVSSVKPLFENIQFGSKITAKNLTVLPAIHRDFNVIRQNIVKLLKLEKIDAATKSDMFFKVASKREDMYESQLLKLREETKTPTKIDGPKSNGSLIDLIVLGGITSVLLLALKEVVDAVDGIQNIDLKKGINNFAQSLTSSFDKMMSMMSSSLDLEDIILDKNKIESPSEIMNLETGKLDFKDVFRRIKVGESKGNYDVAFITKGQKTPEQFSGKKLTEMTLSEVLEFQRQRESVKGGQGAIGAYQFMPTTLFGREGFSGKGKIGGLVGKSGISMDTKFDQSTQDKLADILMSANVDSLNKMGVSITPQNLAMAWSIGPGGVGAVNKAILEGRGEGSVADALESSGLPANRVNNPHLVKNKAKDFYGYFTKKMGYGDETDSVAKNGLSSKTMQPESKNTPPAKPAIKTDSNLKPATKLTPNNINPLPGGLQGLDFTSSMNRTTGSSLQDQFLTVSMGNLSEDVPIVIINNTTQENIIVSNQSNNVPQKDPLGTIFGQMFA